MAPRSQNGWPVLTEPPPRVELVPGVRVTVLPGDVAWLFQRVARFIHEHIEPLDTPVYEDGRRLPTDDWGWAYRPVRGQEEGYSNHASATAMDLNATQHPRGVKRTWTPAETAAIDRMHFEINATAAQVRRVRTKLQAADVEAARAQEEADMPTAAEVAQATLNTPMPLMSYVDALYNDADGKMPLAEAVQHGAGQAYAANQTAGRALAEAQAARRDIAALTALVNQLVVNQTPPASGAGG
jgi:hypothetical protein